MYLFNTRKGKNQYEIKRQDPTKVTLNNVDAPLPAVAIHSVAFSRKSLFMSDFSSGEDL